MAATPGPPGCSCVGKGAGVETRMHSAAVQAAKGDVAMSCRTLGVAAMDVEEPKELVNTAR